MIDPASGLKHLPVKTGPSRDAALSVTSLHLERNGRRIARLPDFEIGAGQSVALLGPSGSGKTTALMAISGIRPPAEGEIHVRGTALWNLDRHRRDRFRGRHIGLVFQSFHLIDAVSVAANIRLAAHCAGMPVDLARMDELLERLAIADLRDCPADRISHGQAQRVAVARALINRPAVVLADEPTSALDDTATAQLVSLLKQSCREEGAGLLIASHDRRILDDVDTVIEMEPAV